MRMAWVWSALILAATPALAVDGVDLPGRDYARFAAPSAKSCRLSCGGDSACQAYTWVKPGFQGPTGICYLKNAEPAIVKNPCCDSAPRRFITPRDMTLESRINRPGSDYLNFATIGGSHDWDQCKQACADDDACGSWTYVRRGVQGPQGRCWLKRGVARPVPDENTVSGVKYRPPSQRIDPG
ncbi:PAN domain-containing protein [Hyalangium gracile]|uniref:PAN domain-containing protein n=1 Tax=Hyalangium gracile TaxID=394092 RepID=UPI001CCF43D9|nr:PAN domain-containing protein [Hyalangium gracile]